MMDMKDQRAWRFGSMRDEQMFGAAATLEHTVAGTAISLVDT